MLSISNHKASIQRYSCTHDARLVDIPVGSASDMFRSRCFYEQPKPHWLDYTVAS